MNDVMDKPTKQHTKITSYQKEKIIHKIAREIPQRAIAKQHGITQPAVSDIKKANEVRVAEVKEELLAENLDNIQSSIKTDIENNNFISKNFNYTGEITTQDIAYKSATQKNIIKPLLESIGIYPSNTIHYGDNNIQVNEIISPSFQAFMDYKAKAIGEVIDV